MQYMAGKSRIRKFIARDIELLRKGGQPYFEPFVGGAWVLQEVSGKRTASDGNKALITMYKELQNGWVPPDFVSEEEYKKYQSTKDDNDPMTAFVGIGCSFSGKWFGGYARSEGKSCYASGSRNSLLKQLPLIKDVEFIYGNFDEHNPSGNMIYCDPPYLGTTKYGYFKDSFNTGHFWDVMREWSKTNTVLISEYDAPEDFICIDQIASSVSAGTVERPIQTDRLYIHESMVKNGVL